MRSRTTIIATIIFAWLLGVTLHRLHHRLAATSGEEASRSVIKAETPSQAAPTPQQGQLSKPSPPPSTGISITMPSLEPVRTLTEAENEQLKRIEQALPEGARVATYRAVKTHLKAALVTTDLDGDGKAETIVVHTNQPATDKEPLPQLALSVLTHEGDLIKVRSSTRLADGGVLFNIDLNGATAPITVQDVTGDKRPEILVATGIGASLGGTLQVYTVEGLSLRQIGSIAGHSFYVRRQSDGNSYKIFARWRDESEVTVYEWNGHSFEQTGKMNWRDR